jgi:hypothetical protein
MEASLRAEVAQLREEVARGAEQRQQLVEWIRDNLGPSCGLLDARIDARIERHCGSPQHPTAIAPAAQPKRVFPAGKVPVRTAPKAKAGPKPKAKAFPKAKAKVTRGSGEGRADPFGVNVSAMLPDVDDDDESTGPRSRTFFDQLEGTLAGGGGGAGEFPERRSGSNVDFSDDDEAEGSILRAAPPPKGKSDGAQKSRTPVLNVDTPKPAPTAAEQRKERRRQQRKEREQTEFLGVASSDEEWSDSDEEARAIERRKVSERLRLTARADRLAEIEKTTVVPLIRDYPHRLDASRYTTMAKTNIERALPLLQSIYGCSAPQLMPRVREYVERGGRVLFAPLLTDSSRRGSRAAADQWQFAVRSSDMLKPMCPDGLGCSQVLGVYLRGVKRALGTEAGVEDPHGATQGYDCDLENAAGGGSALLFRPAGPREAGSGSRERLAPELDSAVWLASQFRKAFGAETVPRAGAKIASPFEGNNPRRPNTRWKEAAAARQQLHDYFDVFYWRVDGKRGGSAGKHRVIWLACGAALPQALDRILEANSKKDNSLEETYVIAIPAAPSTLEVRSVPPEFKKQHSHATREIVAVHRLLQMYRSFAEMFPPTLAAFKP